MTLTIRLFVVLWWILVPLSAAAQPAPPLGSLAAPMDSLENGLQITRLPMDGADDVMLTADVHLAPRTAPAIRAGYLDLIGRLITQDHPDNGTSLTERVRSLEAELEVGVQNDALRVTVSGPAGRSSSLADLLADVLQRPVFTDSSVAQARRTLASAVAQRQRALEGAARKHLVETVYEAPTLTHGPDSAAVAAVTADDLEPFYTQSVGAARTHVYVAGQESEDALRRAVAAAFGAWPRGPARPSVPSTSPSPPASGTVHIIDRPEAGSSVLAVGARVPGPGHPDYAALQVASALLGEAYVSRIPTALRGAVGRPAPPQARLELTPSGAHWSYLTPTATSDAATALQTVLDALQALVQTPPTPGETAAATHFVADRLALHASTRDGRVDLLARYARYGLGPDGVDASMERVLEVGPEDVHRVAAQYLGRDALTLVAAGPARALHPQMGMVP